MTKTGDAAQPPLDLESATPMELLQRYQRPLVIGVILVAAAGAGGWLYKRSSDIREQRGAEALSAAEGAYQAGNTAGAQPELAKVVTRYAGTTAGAQAAALSAEWFYEAGQADSGLARLETALPKSPRHLRSGLLALRAAGKSMKGEEAGAAADFEAAAAAAQFQQEKDGLLLQAARAHAAAGNIEAAKAILSEIVEREDSSHAAEARLRLGEITFKG